MSSETGAATIAENEAPQTVSCTVPEGITPGQTISFPGPDGVPLCTVVPEGKKPGDTIEVHLPAMMCVVVPEGVKPGDTVAFDVVVPGGALMKMSAKVPDGKNVGDKFLVPLPPPPPPTHVTLTVPEGVSAGEAVFFPGPNGVQLQAVVPEGLKTGDQFSVPVALPPPLSINLTVPEGMKVGETVYFQGPNGAQMSASVPEGKNPGETFQVLFQPPPERRATVVNVPQGLAVAVSGDDLEEVKKIVANGESVNSSFEHGFSPLSYAAMNGNLAITKWLIEEKANIEALTADKRLPLHFAARNGHVEVAKLLLSVGSPKDSIDILGRSPLATAIEKNQPEVIKVLQDAGCK
jgi:hypothetical protein